MSFLTVCFPFQLPDLSELRDPRENFVAFSYGTFLGLCMYFIVLTSHFPEIDLTLDDNIYQVINLYSNHRHWYLAIWNFAIEIIFSAVCLLDFKFCKVNCDLNWQKRIYQSRCYIFHGLVVPITTASASGFWLLFSIPEMRKIILPKELNEVIPLWIFIVLHSASFFPILIEHIIFVPLTKCEQRPAHIIYLSIYWFHIILFLFFHFINSEWLYPVFNHIHWLLACGLVVGGSILGHIVISGSILLHNYRCRQVPLQRRTSLD